MGKAFLLLGLLAGSALSGAAVAKPGYEEREIARLATPELQKFEDDRAFRRYLREVRAAQRRVREAQVRTSQLSPTPAPAQTAENAEKQIVIAAVQDSGPSEEDICTDPDMCPEESANDVVIVTGSRIQAQPMSTAVAVASITNNQKLGVDEGDIVKRIGDYFVVLQDGRIFAVNFKTMQLTDRIDVYRKDEDGDPTGADWYDEMLTQGDQIIITAYSYEDNASELSVFKLDERTGKIDRRGVFLISSDDYFDIDNYATRVVGDNLVIHTPYEAEDLARRSGRPSIRRWVPDEDFDDEEARGKPILDATDIYRPVFGIKDPWVHTISVCPLGNVASRDLRCTSTAFVGSEYAEMFVSPNATFLFTSAAEYDDFWANDYCDANVSRASAELVPPGAIFRMPHRSETVDVLAVRGVPYDQFSMDETAGRFRMLSDWRRTDCDADDIPREFALVDQPIRAFAKQYRPVLDSQLTPLPAALPGAGMQNRFIGPWLVYGTRESWGGRPPSGESRTGIINVVPVATPEDALTIPINHQVTRLESLGNDAIITGYQDMKGLLISYLDLDGETPAITGQEALKRRYESEGRSHAFNATFTAGGGGLMGLPTVITTDQSNRYPWYSETSDLSFIEFDDTGKLMNLGAIAGLPKDDVEVAEGYSCEVSCIDWYGNARPFFVDGRIFGLMGTNLVEASVSNQTITERVRIDLTGIPQTLAQ